MTSLFTRKKPDDLYQSMVSAVHPTFAPKTPNYTQGLFSSQVRQPTQPQMSVAPKTIQGSGYGSQYASNPTNYKPTPPPTTLPPAPVPTPMSQYTKTIDDYFKRMSDQSAQRVATEEASRQKNQELLNQRYGLMNDSIRGSVPVLNSNFNTFKANTQADVADTVAQGERQKEQTRDYYGEAERTAAQARGETQAQARQKFAAQGAVDSRGAGSYTQANENIDSDFNRYVQKNSKEMAMKLTDIDSAVGQYQRQASTLIQTEEAKLQESLRQIEFTLADNEIAKEQAMNEAYQASQTRINQIQDTLAGIEQQAITQKQTVQLELDKLAKTQFSPEFMATGVPTNQSEYEFMVTNADKMKELGLLGGGDASLQAKSDIINLVDQVVTAGVGDITGWDAFRGNIPSSKSRDKKALVEQIKNKLSLEEREKLRGTGTITDTEQNMLAKSVTALDYGMTEQAFINELNQIKSILERSGARGSQQMSGGATSSNMSMSSNIITAPDGQQVMIVD